MVGPWLTPRSGPRPLTSTETEVGTEGSGGWPRNGDNKDEGAPVSGDSKNKGGPPGSPKAVGSSVGAGVGVGVFQGLGLGSGRPGSAQPKRRQSNLVAIPEVRSCTASLVGEGEGEGEEINSQSISREEI